VTTERPLPVSASCASAILEGRKSMVRYIADGALELCPFARPGDRLWVAEPWAVFEGTFLHQALHRELDLAWQPPRTMPRELARSWVEIDSARLERIVEISTPDLAAEGRPWIDESIACDSPRQGFARWWDSLHRRAGTQWRDNPLVWVLAFRQVANP
jgi:hypothetical protein